MASRAIGASVRAVKGRRLIPTKQALVLVSFSGATYYHEG